MFVCLRSVFRRKVGSDTGKKLEKMEFVVLCFFKCWLGSAVSDGFFSRYVLFLVLENGRILGVVREE